MNISENYKSGRKNGELHFKHNEYKSGRKIACEYQERLVESVFNFKTSPFPGPEVPLAVAWVDNR